MMRKRKRSKREDDGKTDFRNSIFNQVKQFNAATPAQKRIISNVDTVHHSSTKKKSQKTDKHDENQYWNPKVYEDCKVRKERSLHGSPRKKRKRSLKDKWQMTFVELSDLDKYSSFTSVIDDIDIPELTIPEPEEKRYNGNYFNCTYSEFLKRFPTEKDAIILLYKCGALILQEKCSKCDHEGPFTLYNRPRDGILPEESLASPYRQYFKCECGNRWSILRGSWLLLFRTISYRTICKLLWMYCKGLPTSSIISMLDGELDKYVIYRFCRFCRFVCFIHLKAEPVQFAQLFQRDCDMNKDDIVISIFKDHINNDSQTICGKVDSSRIKGSETIITTDTVALDETYCTKKKVMSKKRGLKKQVVLVFGISTIKGGKCIFHIIPNCKKDQLQPLIDYYIDKNMTVYTDGHASYRRLKEAGFDHHWVNHSLHQWKDYETGCTTNPIEGAWGNFKVEEMWMHGISGGIWNFDSYLSQFCYRRIFDPKSKTFANRFLHSLRRFYLEAKEYYDKSLGDPWCDYYTKDQMPTKLEDCDDLPFFSQDNCSCFVCSNGTSVVEEDEIHE